MSSNDRNYSGDLTGMSLLESLSSRMWCRKNAVQNFMEKQDITGQKLPKYSKKLRNKGQKSRKYHLCVKNENMQNINASC